MAEVTLGRHRRTSTATWVAAIACAVLSTAVIVGGMVVTVVYLIHRPKIPVLKVASSRLLRLYYEDAAGLLGVNVSLGLVAVNPNPRSHAAFSDLALSLAVGFSTRAVVAELRSAPFEVPKRGSVPISYAVESWPVPLGDAATAEMRTALRIDRVDFQLAGRARTAWRLGVWLRLAFWTHVSCHLLFFPSNGTTIGVDCRSKSHQ